MLKKKQVKCSTCKHWIDKEDAQEIKDGYGWYEYFCKMHKKPYDKELYLRNRIAYMKRIDTTIEVDIKGKPVDKNWYKNLII